jgi:hypothetical protein
MMWIKSRTNTEGWVVYHKEVYESLTGNFRMLMLNEDYDTNGNINRINSTQPTSTVFSVGGDQSTGSQDYICYLFASLTGISKIGKYEGTGSAIDINCGFTGGARFVMIKRYDSTGDWYVFDTARGIGAGNDERMYFNGASSNHTTDDYIDPLTGGFTVTTHAQVNTDNAKYLYMAIA